MKIFYFKNNKILGVNFLTLKKKDLYRTGLKTGLVVSLHNFIKVINSGKVYFD